MSSLAKRLLLLNQAGLAPASRCRYLIDLGLKQTIKALFSNPEWSRQRGRHRDLKWAGSWWKGSEVKRLREYGRTHRYVSLVAATSISAAVAAAAVTTCCTTGCTAFELSQFEMPCAI
jgi:hypothetical protein